jgi:regulator of protease activity HflC (stomatin/prohibitin superfamily)
MFVVQLIIFIIACLMAYFVGRRAFRGDNTINYSAIIEAAAILIVALTLNSAFGEIPAGYRGVVTRFSATTGEVKQPGFYTVVPFVTQVVPMSVQVQAYTTDASSASHDLQDVATTVTLNYNIDSDPIRLVDIYNRLGQDYQDRIIAPAIQEATKAATAQFSAEELITKRPAARDMLQNNLAARLESFDIHIAAMSITNFKFSDQFTQAIENKVIAQQKFFQEQNTLNQIKVQAAEAIASANGEAQANRLRRQQITPLTVEYDAVQKWDGKLPGVMGTGAVPFFNLGNLDSATGSKL